jgi:phosphate:Na+ symporter
MIVKLCQASGLGNPNDLYNFVTNLQATDPVVYNNVFTNTLSSTHPAQERVAVAAKQIAAMQASASICLSIFYTIYKLINLSIMIWFTNFYVKVVEWIVPTRKKSDDEFGLKFIQGGLLSSSELSIAQAEKEIAVFAERVGRMIVMAHTLIHTKEQSEEFNNLLSRIEKYEDISDRMEIEIAHYLNTCAQGRLSNEGKLKISGMINIISEIESIADCCYGIGKIMMRKIESKAEFTDEIYSNIDKMYDYLTDAMSLMLELLADIENVDERHIIDSYNKEREINNMRNMLRGANVNNIADNRYAYQAGIYYMDIISDLERTGDYIINVVDVAKRMFISPKHGTNA